MPLNSEPSPQFHIIAPPDNSISVTSPENKTDSAEKIIPPAHIILNDQNQSSAVEISGQQYELKIKTQSTTIDKFFGLKLTHKSPLLPKLLQEDSNDYQNRSLFRESPFKYPLANRIYIDTIKAFESRYASQISQPYLEDAKDMSEKESTKFWGKQIAPQIHRDSVKDTDEYLDDLRHNFQNSPVTIHEFQIDSDPPIKYTRIILGDIKSQNPQDAHAIDETVISTVHFLENTLHQSIPEKPITLVQFALPEIEPDSNEFRSQIINNVLDLGGFYSCTTNTSFVDSSPSVIISFIDSSNQDVHTKFATEAKWLLPFTAHEIAHQVDDQVNASTRPQCEGFATSVQYDFNYQILKRKLFRNSQYRRDVTPHKILEIFSKPEPTGAPYFEKYTLSGTFLSWIYQHHGPDTFISFYRNLINPELYSQEQPTQKTMACLALALQSDKTSPISKDSYLQATNLLAQFTSDINHKES